MYDRGCFIEIFSLPVGEVREQSEINKMKSIVNSNDLEMEVIESVAVYEDVKLCDGNYQMNIDSYKENIRRLAATGGKVYLL